MKLQKLVQSFLCFHIIPMLRENYRVFNHINPGHSMKYAHTGLNPMNPHALELNAKFQISAKRGPDSRFVIEVNTEALVSKLNSRFIHE